MRRYSQNVEERLRAERNIREWVRSGLLDSERQQPLMAELSIDLKRTNNSLRLVLFFFTSLILIASVWLFTEVLAIREIKSLAVLHLLAAVLCFGFADFLVARGRLYRFGVEEVLAIGAVVLLCVSAGEFAATRIGSPFADRTVLIFALAVGAVGAFGVYLRFGYLYAAVLSMAAAAAIAFPLVDSAVWGRVPAAGAFVLFFLIGRGKREPHGDEFPGDDYGVIQAAAWIGMYLVLNLQLPGAREVPSGFYWTTYALIWIIPAVGLAIGVGAKHRNMIHANLGLAIITLITNKPYLRMPRHSWDPILLGVLLTGVAFLVRRWLANGPDAPRRGFTAKRLLASERRVIPVVGMAAHPTHSNPTLKPGGGQSGGGGASGSF